MDWTAVWAKTASVFITALVFAIFSAISAWITIRITVRNMATRLREHGEHAIQVDKRVVELEKNQYHISREQSQMQKLIETQQTQVQGISRTLAKVEAHLGVLVDNSRSRH